MGSIIMEEKENNIELVKISEADVPNLIQEQFVILSEYTSNFENAKKKALEVKQRALESQEKGVHVFKMKGSIEDLQANQVDLSESINLNMDLQEKSLEYQKKITEIMQYLFGLGVANITINRCVVKELQMRLDNATDNEIDEMARKEIIKVVQQLKENEDHYNKTMEIIGKVKEHDSKLSTQETKDIEHDRILEELKEKDDRLSEDIKVLQNNLSKYKKVLIITGIVTAISLIIGVVALVFSII